MFALALKSAPNQLVGDTKLDLSVDPGRFLSRALHLWDPSGDFGQTQNQSYGYLFPMGPFFWLGHLVGLPPWVVQRLWWGALLSLAFLGMVRLSERLNLGSPFSRVVGGLAFALSPRVLSSLGPISVEILPYCLAPWVLVPLVSGSRAGSTRRAAAQSAVAVLCMGAVNAAAVLAALPPALLWLLTRQRGPRRTSLLRWWVLCVALATSWWVAPLLLLGKYSPPFLDYIENASITTSVTSLVEVLRGTSDWVAYVGGSHGPAWPLGSALLTTAVVIVYTVVVVAGGVGGLLRPDLPERWWLTLCLLIGVAAVTAGHLGHLSGTFAETERSLLDGALAPFRNVHKFDVVLRVPLVLGLVHLLGSVGVRATGRVQPLALRAAAVAAVLGAALPCLSTGIAPRGPFAEIAGYWRQTASWLAAHQQDGSALLLPGSRFPDYVWGSTNDEPLQVLHGSRWAVRGAIPLTPAGTIRYLDAIEQRLAAGTPSAGLADDLARAGIHYLVVRNDLNYGAAQATRPLLVHEALATSPGIVRTVTFGGMVGGLAGNVDEGLDVPYPAVEVYEVQRDTPRAALSPLSQVVQVTGGPEALLGLDDRFLLRGRPAVLDVDRFPARSTAPGVLTDSLQRREVFFGGAQTDSTSPTLTSANPYRLRAPAHDYLLPGERGHQTVARLVGAKSVAASSSASDAVAFGGAQPAHLPYAAVDADPLTSWRSDAARSVGRASWRVRFDQPRTVKGLTVRFDVPQAGTVPRTARVSTDTEAVVVAVPVGGGSVPIQGLTGTTSALTVATASTSGSGLGYLGIADVSLPELAVSRTLDTALGQGTPVIALDAEAGDRRSCFVVVADTLCSTSVGAAGPEAGVLDRTLHLTGAGSYRLSASAVPVPGAVLNGLLDGGTGLQVSASSTAVAAPAARPATVLDGDLLTGWRAATGDRDPALTIIYPQSQTVTGLRLQVQQSLSAGRARGVRVDATGGSRQGTLERDGRLSFPALTGNRFTVHLTDVVPATSIDPYSLTGSLLPVGVSELTLTGAATPRTPPARVTIPCAVGPVVRVGNQLLRTTARTDRPTLQRQGPAILTVCGPDAVDVADGTRVVAPASPLLRPVSLTMRPVFGVFLPAVPSPGVPLSPSSWQATSRELPLPSRSGPALLQVHENTNPGWQARFAGRRLTPVVVDGWQQGWVVPAGAAGTVSLRFMPDQDFRRGLLIGGLAVLVLLVLAGVHGSSAAIAAAPARTGLVAVLASAGLLVVIGGTVAAGLALVAVLVGGSRWASQRSVSAVLAVLGAGLLLAVHPWPGADYAGRALVPQLLCLLALVLLWSSLLPSLRSFKRRAGRSTSR